MSIFKFKIIKKDKRSRARAGQIETAHGFINTPCFIPVGTRASVRSLTPADLKEIGVQIIFGNTYHLHLRPGEETVQKFGGLAKFMGWGGPASPNGSLGGPTITDSGGFQVFSLGRSRGRLPHVANDARRAQSKNQVSSSSSLSERRPPESILSLQNNTGSAFNSFANGQTTTQDDTPVLVKINDDGVEFRSHIDGSLHVFTPEESIKIQQKLGADIILAFDECAPHTSTYEYTKKAMERTHDWAVRSLKYFTKSEIRNKKSETNLNDKNTNNRKNFENSNFDIVSSFDIRASSFPARQALYGIVQGGIYKDLREESAKFISSLPFDGIAIGGVSVGESKKEMRDVLDWVVPYLSEDKPRHLLGAGEVDDIFEAVERGMDTFDCVIPTRFGRYGILFVHPSESEDRGKFRIDLNRPKYAKDKRPIAKDCKCMVCRDFTRAYIHHLFRSRELLAYRLASYHNLYFIIKLVDKIRDSILDDNFEKMKEDWIKD